MPASGSPLDFASQDDIHDAIGVLGGQTIVTRCFQGATEFCPLIQRDPATNQITLITDVQQNVNELITSGLDVELAYRQPTERFGIFDDPPVRTAVRQPRGAVGTP